MSSPRKAIAIFNDDEKAAEYSKGSNSGSSRKVHPKSYYTPAFKLEVVNYAKKSSDILAGKRFQVNRCSVLKWRKNEDELKMLNSKIEMNAQNRKRQRPAAEDNEQQEEMHQEEQEHNHENNDDHDDNNSTAITETFTDFELEGSSTNDNNDGNGMEAFTWKWRMAALEAKNKMLEGKNQMLQGKLENQEFQAKIRAMTAGSGVEKLKEENRALLKRLKEAEEKAQVANDKLKKIMEVIQQNTVKGNEETAKELSSAISMDAQPQQQKQLQHQKPQQHKHKQEYVQNIRAEKQKEKSYKEDDDENDEEEEEEYEEGEDNSDSDKTGYEVEEILNRKTFLNGQEKYFIKWKNYGSEHNTWEPKEGLEHLDVFKEYMAKQKGATEKSVENGKEMPKGMAKGMPKGMPKGMSKGMPKRTKKKKFKVERILDQKQVGKGKMEYFVKWKGYSRNTWEPRRNLAHLNVFKAYELNYHAAGTSGTPATTSTPAATAVGSPKKKGRPSAMTIKRPSSVQSQLSTISAMFAENGGEDGQNETLNLNSSGNGK